MLVLIGLFIPKLRLNFFLIYLYFAELTQYKVFQLVPKLVFLLFALLLLVDDFLLFILNFFEQSL